MSKELVEKINKLHTEFTEANDAAIEQRKKDGVETAETRAKVDALTGDILALNKELEHVRAKNQAPAADPDVEKMSMEKRKAWDGYLRRGITSLEPEQRRSLSQASDSDGSFLAPEELESNITMKASELAVIRPLADVGTTGRSVVIGGLLSKPIVAWGREKLDIAEQDLAAGNNRLEIHDLRGLFLVSNDTLEDTEADVIGELSNAFGGVIAEEEDTVFATGADGNKPLGIVADPLIQANFTKSGVAAAISDGTHNGIDALIDLMAALKGVYRLNANWLMNSATMGKYMQLKDGNGQYLWLPHATVGAPATLLGKGVHTAEGMPAIAAGSIPVALGDMKYYKIRDRSGLTIKRLDERYAEKDMVGFIVKKRVGGMPRLSEAFQVLKIAA